MAQSITPDSDVTTTTWTSTGANFHSVLAAISDADYAEAPFGTTDAAPLVIGLSNPASTPGDNEVTISYRARRVDAGGSTLSSDLTVKIMQGAGTTLYTSTTVVLTDAFALYTITGANLVGVTDWNDLRIRFEFASAGGDPFGCRISYANVSASDAGGGPVSLHPRTALTGAGRL